MKFAVGMHQNQGKREYQQDAMSIKQFGSIGVLAILADGMGGYEGGEIASQLVSENFREFTIEGEDIAASLKKYLFQGNEAIRQYKSEHPEVKSMGTTAIAFFMTDKISQWISVGDSPLYVIRRRHSISRINENHSIAGLLDLQVKKGEITEEEALSSGQRHMLTSAVSGEDIPQMDISVPYAIKDNDIFILASDGIETIDESRIKEIVLGLTASGVTQENVQKASEVLVSEVMNQNTPNQDNVTVIIIAKIEDNEPQTIMYTPPVLHEKKKWLITAAGVGILLLILFLLYAFLKEENISAEPVKKSTTVKKEKILTETTKIEKKKEMISVPKVEEKKEEKKVVVPVHEPEKKPETNSTESITDTKSLNKVVLDQESVKRDTPVIHIKVEEDSSYQNNTATKKEEEEKKRVLNTENENDAIDNF
jgi:serine/threonine protein phosphatase PrpC